MLRHIAILSLTVIAALTFHTATLAARPIGERTMSRTAEAVSMPGSLHMPRPQSLMECYNRFTKVVSLVQSEDFRKNPDCLFNFQDKVLFLHLGKGGGGTVNTVQYQHRITFHKCHPTPGNCRGNKAKAEQVLINIRDPVDRFVSAFNWRSLIPCNRDTEVDPRTRSPPGRGQVSNHPDEFCAESKANTRERDMLHGIYHSNINELAESLCEEGPEGDLARQHTSEIQHAKTYLSDWIDHFILAQDQDHQPRLPSLQQIMAVVVEPTPNDPPFAETVSNAMRYLIQKEYPHATPDFFPSPTSTIQEEDNRHSTQDVTTFPGGIPKTPVSRLGECCLARHLAKDYEILQALAGMNSSGSRVDAAWSMLAGGVHERTLRDAKIV